MNGAEPTLELDLRSPVPPFEQIRAGISAFVDAGVLAPGDRLPSVRALAADLGVAPNTVVRAYRELESAGVVRTARGKGTVVADRPRGALTADDDRTARTLEAAVHSALAAGWDRERVQRVVEATLVSPPAPVDRKDTP